MERRRNATSLVLLLVSLIVIFCCILMVGIEAKKSSSKHHRGGSSSKASSSASSSSSSNPSTNPPDRKYDKEEEEEKEEEASESAVRSKKTKKKPKSDKESGGSNTKAVGLKLPSSSGSGSGSGSEGRGVTCHMNTRKECSAAAATETIAGKAAYKAAQQSCANVQETCKGSCCMTEIRSGSRRINQFCYDEYACGIVKAAIKQSAKKLGNCFTWDNYKRCVCSEDRCNKEDALAAYSIYADGIERNSAGGRSDGGLFRWLQ